MTAKFRLFISHSSRDDSARQRLLAIVDALRDQAADEIHVLVDKEQIEPDDEWRPRISHMLTLCDGAAILLDSPAVLSKWVPAEAMVLSTRRAVEPDFRLLTVRLAGRAELDEAHRTASARLDAARTASWDPVDLGRLQEIGAEGEAPDQVAAKIVAALREKGDLRGRRSSLERYADELADVLDKAPQNRLRDLADELDDATTPTVFAAEELSRRSALAIARHFVATPSLDDAANFLGRLGTVFVRERGRTLIDLLHPVAFDAHTAAYLVRPRPGGGYEPVVMAADKWEYSVTGQLRLAHLPRALVDPLYFLPGRYATAASMRAELLEQHRTHKRQNSPPGARPADWTDDELANGLRTLQFGICAPVVDGGVLTAMSREFPSASFVLVHSADEPAPSLPGTRRVLPPLGRVHEDQIFQAHQNALLKINPLVST